MKHPALLASWAAAGLTTGCALTVAVLSSRDPASSWARAGVERAVNGYLERMRLRTAADGLGPRDAAALRAGVALGAGIGQGISPEGAALLWHAAHGSGDLTLDPSYFRRSPYLAAEIARRGPGEHGPIPVPGGQDPRLALTLNPFYLSISPTRIRVGHPRVAFAAPDAPLVYTVVPLGRMQLRVPDNLVGALQGEPFAAWAEWAP